MWAPLQSEAVPTPLMRPIVSALTLLGVLHAGLAIFVPEARTLVWKVRAGVLHAAFVVYVLYTLPIARDHFTLWVNSLYALYFVATIAASTHPDLYRRVAWLLHVPSLVAAIGLPAAYLLVLHASGEGSLERGFVVIDVRQWADDWPVAIAISTMLHAWPLLLLYLDATYFGDALARVYPRATWPIVAWGACALLGIGVVYDVVSTLRHGSPAAAITANYRVPAAAVPYLDVKLKLVNVASVCATALFVRWQLMPRDGHPKAD